MNDLVSMLTYVSQIIIYKHTLMQVYNTIKCNISAFSITYSPVIVQLINFTNNMHVVAVVCAMCNILPQ